MKKIAFALSMSLLFFVGCRTNSPQPQSNKSIKLTYNNKTCVIDNTHSKTCIFTIEAVGKGVAPCSGACSVHKLS